jgi:hypothetical protein
VRRDRRFPVVLSKCERQALQQIAHDEVMSAAAVVRRLIIHEAKRRGLWLGARSGREQRLSESAEEGEAGSL